jgi:hypothetical protein
MLLKDGKPLRLDSRSPAWLAVTRSSQRWRRSWRSAISDDLGPGGID